MHWFRLHSLRFTNSQIMAILKQAEAGISILNLCREHGISSATFNKRRSKFGGMDTPMIKRLKELEEENRRLKKMYAEEGFKSELRQEALEGSWRGYFASNLSLRPIGRRLQSSYYRQISSSCCATSA
jgi:putative transposase